MARGGRGRAEGGGPGRAGSVVRGLPHSDEVHVSGRKDAPQPRSDSRGPLWHRRTGRPSWALGPPAVGVAAEGGSHVLSPPDHWALSSLLSGASGPPGPSPGGVRENTRQPQTVKCVAGEAGRRMESGQGTWTVSSAPPCQPWSPRHGPKEKACLRAYLGAIRPPPREPQGPRHRPLEQPLSQVPLFSSQAHWLRASLLPSSAAGLGGGSGGTEPS